RRPPLEARQDERDEFGFKPRGLKRGPGSDSFEIAPLGRGRIFPRPHAASTARGPRRFRERHPSRRGLPADGAEKELALPFLESPAAHIQPALNAYDLRKIHFWIADPPLDRPWVPINFVGDVGSNRQKHIAGVYIDGHGARDAGRALLFAGG